MRNRKEILGFIEALVPSKRDPFGVMVGCLTGFLKYRDAAQYLKDDTTREQWNASRLHLSDDVVIKLMGQGTRMGWKLANDHMGVEVNKSFMILDALCFLLGDRHHKWAIHMFWTRGILVHYGKPQLVELHERYQLGTWEEHDDGKWRDIEKDLDLTAEAALKRWRDRWLGKPGQTLRLIRSNGKDIE